MAHINKKQLSNVMKHLETLYPLIKHDFLTFNHTLESWLKKSETMDVIEGIKLIVPSVCCTIEEYSDDDPSFDAILSYIIEHSDGRPSWINLKPFDIYNKNQFVDFGMIRFASSFYGKTFEKFIDDISKIFRLNNLFNLSLQNKFFYKKLRHVVLCHFLMTIGFVFYHFQMSIILDNADPHLHECVRNSIFELISINTSINNTKFNEEDLPNYENIYYAILNKKNKVNTPAKKMEKIYDMHYHMMSLVYSMTQAEFKEFVSKNPDFNVHFNDQKSLKYRLILFRTKKYFLSMVNIEIKKNEEIESIENIFPKILNTHDMYLTIEI